MSEQEPLDRIQRLFRGFEGAYGTHGDTDRSAAKGGKLEIKRTARTIRESVTPDLWLAHLEGRQPLGIIPITEDNTCWWGCIDVDRYDLTHAELVSQVESRNLPLLLCKSKSGGAHLFMFLAEPVDAGEFQAHLRQISASLGLGECEIFPKQSRILLDRGDLGNWLNMPYYGGDESNRVGVKRTGAEMSLGEFLTRAEHMLVTLDELEQLIPGPGSTKSPAATLLADGPPCLQHLCEQGFPEGTRNNGLFGLGVYCKKKYGEKWKEELQKLNQEAMNPPLSFDEVNNVATNLERKDYGYKCKDSPCLEHCNGGLCKTRRFGVGGGDMWPSVSGISKLDSDPPVWFLDIEGERVELSTDDLLNYRRFQARCMETLTTVFQMMKQTDWISLLSPLMQSAIIIEAAPEVGISGQFAELVEEFCTNRHRGEKREDILLGKPWLDEDSGRHYFRVKDLQSFLDKQGFRAYNRGQIVTKIRELGGDGQFLKVSNRGVNCWWVPRDIGTAPTIKTAEKEAPPI